MSEIETSDTPAAEAAPAQEAPATEAEQPKTFDAEYVEKLRRENASLRVKNKELEPKAAAFDERSEAEKSELQKAQEAREAAERRAAELESGLLRAEIAAETGVPSNLLSGSSREELQASAEALLAFRGQQQQAAPDFGAGQRGTTKAGGRQLTAADLKSMTPQQINEARRNGELDALMGRQ